jgi:hypothetical protein
VTFTSGGEQEDSWVLRSSVIVNAPSVLVSSAADLACKRNPRNVVPAELDTETGGMRNHIFKYAYSEQISYKRNDEIHKLGPMTKFDSGIEGPCVDGGGAPEPSCFIRLFLLC